MTDITTFQDVWGNEIFLTSERLVHIEEHPEIKLETNALIETISATEVIVRSKSDASILLFYKFFQTKSIGEKFFCVVVKYTETRNFIITAYFTDKVKEGEILWRR